MNTAWLTRDKLFGAAITMLFFPIIQQAAPFFTVGLLQSLQERMTFPMIEQRIEVVRRAASQMSCPPAVADAPIMAQVLDWDLRISHEKQSNLLWYSDLFSTDQWNNVEAIPLPCEPKLAERH